MTLVELVVALALLGLILGMSGIAVVTLRLPSNADAARNLRRARAEAIRIGRPVRIPGSLPDTGHGLFLPDGRALGPGVDPLTGAVNANPR